MGPQLGRRKQTPLALATDEICWGVRVLGGLLLLSVSPLHLPGERDKVGEAALARRWPGLARARMMKALGVMAE